MGRSPAFVEEGTNLVGALGIRSDPAVDRVQHCCGPLGSVLALDTQYRIGRCGTDEGTDHGQVGRIGRGEFRGGGRGNAARRVSVKHDRCAGLGCRGTSRVQQRTRAGDSAQEFVLARGSEPLIIRGDHLISLGQ